MKVLVTGFDPFGGESVNPSFEAVKLLPDSLEGHSVHKLELPTVFGKGAQLLEWEIRRLRPEIVLCTGQAGGRKGITAEQVAINLRCCTLADNEGNVLAPCPVVPGGPDAYFARLPIETILSDLKDAGVPSGRSLSAGSFVCNDVMYSLLHLIAADFPAVMGGFVHVPYIPSQVAGKDVPAMELDEIEKALEIILRACIRAYGQ